MEKLTYLTLRQIERGATSPEFSHLEQKFPRIAMKLVEVWQSDACRDYLHSLLMDDRGDRQGFPAEVMDELLMLDNIHWSNDPNATAQGLTGGYDFRFSKPSTPVAMPQVHEHSHNWFKRLFA
ncbi:MAG: hypothetical protein HXY27_09465 [Hydrogenophilaceae bacterium]|nr:hypothetical protein [Hydrogenophilaceae bacterium]